MYFITGTLGLISMLAPFMFGYTYNTVALWSSFVVGALLMLDSALEGAADDTQRWEYVVAVILGLVTLAAPFVLRFSTVTEALWTSVIVGVVSVLVAGERLSSGDLK